ncbi:hypothetical protein M6I34_06240 [Burkholderiaceae bacterium FT117]|uniref:hypothetical protein n=1 Tax=Zeimonas sediminis TaxID=2944268 RepID=UPI002343180E|nr:hypothetical protein [Zeimonas sediminis]MCM5570101.1 hypothetical protein [Zeimonas sediminis]
MKFLPTAFAAASKLRPLALLAASLTVLGLAGCGSGSDGVAPTVIIEAKLDTQVAQIGGATAATSYYKDAAGTEWALFSMANRFAATPIGTTKAAAAEITVPGYILHITPVTHEGTPYALLSMGEKGIGVVDLSNPAAMSLVHVINVNYEKTGVDYVDGGGNPVAGATIAGTAGSITDLAVYEEAGVNQLLIANGAFGIHKTRLSNLLPAPVTEADGTLLVDSELWTLQYAGEIAWGGPESLKLHQDGAGKLRLYAALGFLGIAIYDPADLTVYDPANAGYVRPARYNLYTDETVSEDWFGARSLSASVAAPTYLDPDTGMPTWQQAEWEINTLWRESGIDTSICKNPDWCAPWASFDRYGKYYYKARALDIVNLPAAGGQPARTMAYIAYSLGGLVAVDVSDPENAAPSYAGYVAAVPAHGAERPTGTQARSLFPHFGSGMLKEAGVVDVRVVADAGGHKAYYSDHFAGLVVVEGAEDPGARWRNAGAPFDNDIFPEPYWPDYEFVTSYDMTPVTLSGSDESMPKFVTLDGSSFIGPVQLVSGEISGHGGALFLMPGMDAGAAGQVDVVQATGGGGLNFIDIKGFSGTALTDYFEVPVRHVSTAEVGAAADGSATQPIAIGHAEGVTVSGEHAYLADGPHGISVWRIASGGVPTDDLRLVANTLQAEYPVNGVLPTPHAFKVYFGEEPGKAYVMSQSLGMRRVDVSGVPFAAPGAPTLLTLTASDIFEHSTDLYTVDKKITAVNSQDHAYGVAFHGKYALVADGGNGLTVYDVTADPAAGTSAHLVANIGGTEPGRPPLGRSSSVKLWTDPQTARMYAFVAAGAYGVSVVEVTDLLVNGVVPGLKLIKTFEPKKYDEDKVGSADGKSVDVHVVGDHVFFSYDSFGLVAYSIADLIQPVVEFQPVGQPEGACADVTDVTALSAKQGRAVDCRPESVGRFRLQSVAGYETADGGALFMTPQYFPANVLLSDGSNTYTLDAPRLLFYVAYGAAGVVKLDWSDPANPQMMAIQDTVGSASATAVANGRVYVADGAGGLAVFK